jgi:hypothetical protein
VGPGGSGKEGFETISRRSPQPLDLSLCTVFLCNFFAPLLPSNVKFYYTPLVNLKPHLAFPSKIALIFLGPAASETGIERCRVQGQNQGQAGHSDAAGGGGDEQQHPRCPSSPWRPGDGRRRGGEGAEGGEAAAEGGGAAATERGAYAQPGAPWFHLGTDTNR